MPEFSSSRLVSSLAALFIPGAVHAQLPAGNWQYAWGDDFSGNAVDTGKWNIASPSWTMPNSLAVASADKVRVAGGVLTLDATRTATSGGTQFSSGSVSTYQKKNFNGGYIEARIFLPDTPGSWPAFWGLYDGWPPECDIMEYPIDTAAGSGYAQDEYHTAFHYTNSSGNAAAGAGKVNPGSAGDLGGSYHTFAVRWIEDSSVTFYFDGQPVSSFNSAADVAEMAHMYLILDYAVGGWPGTPNTTEWPLGFTDKTLVDWVRVWTSAASKTSDWTNPGTAEYATWDTTANWTNGVPNLGGVTSHFGTVTPAAQNIDWSGSRMLSVINLSGGTRYRFGWPDDRLVLGFGDNGAIQPTIHLAASTTAEQEIHGELEWSGTLNLTNDSSQPLLLTGAVRGGDGIAINGPGVISFDGDANTYSGTTVIDSGGAGPAIARARGRNALGLGGLVVIGEQGNATTARLELEDDALVSNPVSLNGRTNPSAAIVNNSGDNAISGTVSVQVGGSDYRIQSNAGTLRLAGNGEGAGGVALRSAAGGSRTVTLQGAGDGEIGGVIENGNATLTLMKEGSGRWTLEKTNTYTGTTTVSEGVLVVDGSTGTGATTAASTARLEGRGTIRTGLTAQSGSTVRAGGIGPTEWLEPIDDFSTYPLGDIGATPNTTGDVWTGVFNGTANADITSVGGDHALAVNGTNASSGWRGAITDLRYAHGTDFSLPDGQAGTYFLRVRSTNPSTTDFIFGLTDQAASTTTAPGNDTTDPWNEYAVMLSIAGGNLRAYSQGAGDVAVTPIGAGQWLNIWIIADNAAKTFRVATSTGTSDGVLHGQTFNFGRRTAATVGSNPLITFGLHERANVPGQIDDLHFASGTNLAFPIETTPPLVSETLTVDGNFTLAAGAELEFELLDESLHGRLAVDGAFLANGVLRVVLADGAPGPSEGDSFDFFDASGGTVDFSSYDLPALSEGLVWDTSAVASGVLSVTSDATVYAGWLLDQTLPPEADAPDFDADGDGIANAFEWLFGSNPLVPDPGPLPTGATRSPIPDEFPSAEPGKSYLTLEATIRKNITGMTLLGQASASLDTLDEAGSSDSVVSFPREDLGDFERREWIYTVPLEDQPRGFMRLKLIDESP